MCFPHRSPSPAAYDSAIAAFLVQRGESAFFTLWGGDNGLVNDAGSFSFSPALDTDYGQPRGLAVETGVASLIFERYFSKATVRYDCNTKTGSFLPAKAVGLAVVTPSAIHDDAPPQPWPSHPTWAPTWDMSRSTIIMPCNITGWFSPGFSAKYGVVDVDWSNAKYLWERSRPMDNSARLLDQAAQIKAINPNTRVWVYRNLVHAGSWFKEVAEKIKDPRYAGWFVKFRHGGAVDLGNNTWHVPPCTGAVCSQLYHSQDQSPETAQDCSGLCDCNGVPCGEYLFDHRNASLREWIVQEHVMGSLGMGNPNVSGFYFDDHWGGAGYEWSTLDIMKRQPVPYNMSACATGPSELNQFCLLDTGLTAEDVKDMLVAWRETLAAAMRAVHAAGGWVWQMFNVNNATATTGSSCTAQYRSACAAGSAEQALTTLYTLAIGRHSPGNPVDPESDVAKFLLLRGPHAYLGTGWVGCVGGWFKPPQYNESYTRPKAFDIDYGMPSDLVCKESAPGVFSREWTKARVQHDCNTGKSTLEMKS